MLYGGVGVCKNAAESTTQHGAVRSQ